MEVPLQPIGKQDIHLLETALLVSALFDPEIIEKMKDPSERITWVDSLAVAAGAFARRKAGMSITEIADELGRSESTIRNHLEGKTEAGKIIEKVYKKLLENKGKLQFEVVANVEKEAKLNKIKEKVEKVLNKLNESVTELEDIYKEL